MSSDLNALTGLSLKIPVYGSLFKMSIKELQTIGANYLVEDCSVSNRHPCIGSCRHRHNSTSLAKKFIYEING